MQRASTLASELIECAGRRGKDGIVVPPPFAAKLLAERERTGLSFDRFISEASGNVSDIVLAGETREGAAVAPHVTIGIDLEP